MFVFNSSEHRSTGKQPYQLLYERTLIIPSACTKTEEPIYNFDDYHFDLKQLKQLQAAHTIARDRLELQKQKTKMTYDKTVNEITVHVGDQVLLQDKARKGKLSAKWRGPFQALELNANENITIRKIRKSVKVHKNLIKPFVQ